MISSRSVRHQFTIHCLPGNVLLGSSALLSSVTEIMLSLRLQIMHIIFIRRHTHAHSKYLRDNPEQIFPTNHGPTKTHIWEKKKRLTRVDSAHHHGNCIDKRDTVTVASGLLHLSSQCLSLSVLGSWEFDVVQILPIPGTRLSLLATRMMRSPRFFFGG